MVDDDAHDDQVKANPIMAFLGKAWSTVWPKLWMTFVWLVFTAAGSVLPLFILAAHEPGDEGAFSFGLLSKGDLLLIALVLIAGSFGDLFYSLCAGKLQKWRGVVAFVLGGQAVLFVAGLLKYMRATRSDGDAMWGVHHSGTVAHASYLVFIGAIAICWASLMLKSAEG